MLGKADLCVEEINCPDCHNGRYGQGHNQTFTTNGFVRGPCNTKNCLFEHSLKQIVYFETQCKMLYSH